MTRVQFETNDPANLMALIAGSNGENFTVTETVLLRDDEDQEIKMAMLMDYNRPKRPGILRRLGSALAALIGTIFLLACLAAYCVIFFFGLAAIFGYVGVQGTMLLGLGGAYLIAWLVVRRARARRAAEGRKRANEIERPESQLVYPG